jgi:hypothetical protein
VRLSLSSAVAGLLLLGAALPLAANDSDASVGLGGVVLTREPRISMESERLTISLSKVTVEYEFLNESDNDITTEVAFPIPPYENTERAGGIRDFDDFRLWVDGQELKYQVEAKAFLWKYDGHGNKVGRPRDVTTVLRRYNIDISSLGHYKDGKYDNVPDFERLSPDARKFLDDYGVIDVEGPGNSIPEWEVRKTYYWQQRFPAHRVLHVRHEYTPAFGFEGMHGEVFDAGSRERLLAEELQRGSDSDVQDESDLLLDACVAPPLQEKIFRDASTVWKADPMGGGYVETMWVDYILTTANSWKTPIKKFELVVERGPDRGWYDPNWDYASFCWDGPVKQVDAHRFEATATDFVPKRELKVLFMTLVPPGTDGAQGASKAGRLSGIFSWRVWLAILLGVLGLALVWIWVRALRRL